MIITTISTTPGAASSVDSVINLNTGDTLPANVNLYASAVDSNDGSANFSFSWHILRKPTASSASLDNSQITNPVLEGVDVWGDYRLFCIATNISSNETSETDPIKAPNSAFVQVRVRSLNLALVKPAAGERDWFSYAYEWVDALEALDPIVDDHETRITNLEGASVTTTFAALTDTEFSTLVPGQVAIYNGSSGKWENGTISSGASNLLLADTDDDFTLTMATGRLTLSGTANEVEVVGVSSAGGVTMTLFFFFSSCLRFFSNLRAFFASFSFNWALLNGIGSSSSHETMAFKKLSKRLMNADSLAIASCSFFDMSKCLTTNSVNSSSSIVFVLSMSPIMRMALDISSSKGRSSSGL